MTSSLLLTKPWCTPLGRPVQVINYLELKQGSGPEEEGGNLDIFPTRFNLFSKVGNMYKI